MIMLKSSIDDADSSMDLVRTLAGAVSDPFIRGWGLKRRGIKRESKLDSLEVSLCHSPETAP